MSVASAMLTYVKSQWLARRSEMVNVIIHKLAGWKHLFQQRNLGGLDRLGMATEFRATASSI